MHSIVQDQSLAAGATITGIIPAWFSKATRVEGYDYPNTRIGSVALYMPLDKPPQRGCYLPVIYQDMLADIYQHLAQPRNLALANTSRSNTADSQLRHDLKSANKHSRVIIEVIGDYLPAKLKDWLTTPNAPNIEVHYVDLPLSQ